MPLNISIVDKEVAELDIPFGKETIHIKFSPNKYTDEFVENHKDMNSTLIGLISDWDITHDVVIKEGKKEETVTQKLPVSEEGFKKLPLRVLTAIWDGIMNAIVPNPKKQTDGGSFT